jgi:hypothetical protein
MTTTKDWIPTTRDGILAMAADWITVCMNRKTDWNIPQEAITELIPQRYRRGGSGNRQTRVHPHPRGHRPVKRPRRDPRTPPIILHQTEKGHD